MHTDKPVKVLVVDDDFMIARVHAKFIDSKGSYQVVGITYNAEQTLEAVEQHQPDLLVLDVYLPDRSGLEILREVRSREVPCDVIFITAAKELGVVEDGFRLGIFDYLIKPFNLERLGASLQKYLEFKSRLSTSVSVDQEVVDNLRKIRAAGSAARALNESGVDIRTLQRIQNCLKSVDQACSAEEVAHLAGVSRSTARTYLDYLVEKNIAVEELLYGAVGRPRRLFRMLGA